MQQIPHLEMHESWHSFTEELSGRQPLRYLIVLSPVIELWVGGL
jgi:hypothetical protein